MTKSVDERTDPVSRMVRNMTAQETVDWLVKYHGLPESSAATVEANLREQYKWHRLQGRLDTRPTAAVVAQLLCLRQSVKALEKPEKNDD